MRRPAGGAGRASAPARPGGAQARRVAARRRRDRAPRTAASSSPAVAPASADLVARQRQLLEAFAESFVGLRKGYEQFGAEVGVRTIHGNVGAAPRAHQQRDPRLPAAAQPGSGGGGARAHRDLRRPRHPPHRDDGGDHRGRARGAAVAGSARQRAGRRRGRVLSRGKTKAQWKSYLERFDQLVTDDDELHTAIFSDDFARAYASVTLGEEGVRRKKEDKK